MTPRTLAILLPILLAPACSGGRGDTEPVDGEDTASADSIAAGASRTSGFVTPNLTPDEAQAVLANYTQIDPQHLVAQNLLDDALLYYDTNKALIPNLGHMAVVDFSLNSGKKRFFLIDMQTGEVVPHMVAHGAGSEVDGSGFATRFSNVDGSHESSLGFVLTGETYDGVHGRSDRLDGLSSTNSNMRSRAIVIHGAAYVHEHASRQGHSFGCFALDTAVKDSVIDALAGGAILYAGLGDGSGQ